MKLCTKLCGGSTRSSVRSSAEALYEALHEALYTEALHNGSAYNGSTTEALYKSFVQSFV